MAQNESSPNREIYRVEFSCQGYQASSNKNFNFEPQISRKRTTSQIQIDIRQNYKDKMRNNATETKKKIQRINEFELVF